MIECKTRGAQRDGGSTVEQRGCCDGGGSVTAQRWRQLGGGATATAASAVVAAAQIVAVAHSATAAAWLEEQRGCGGFLSTIRKCSDARAFGRPEAPMYALERRNILIPTYGPIIDASKKNCKYLQYLWMVACT